MSPQPFNAPRTVKYNPSFLSDEDLIRAFVVRHIDLELVVEIIADNHGAANQHLLIVGPRGSGKTSLVRRAAIAVKRDSELRERWLPVFFTEESYEVTSAGELWLETLMHLADQTEHQGLRRSYEELRTELDDGRLRERALALLLDFADERGVRLMLVIENLHMLADQLSEDDSWQIRHTLQTEARFMVLASATTRFEQIEHTGKAFYELFKIHELQRLTVAECGAVWSAVTGQKLTSNIRPVHILTGGNLRLLTIISSFAHDRTFSSLLSDLMFLVDEHTAYFKSHLDSLPIRERKVYLALAEIWAPATARSVSEAARVDVNQTSSLLNRLVKRGAVMVVEQVSRKKIYQLSERLYNVYYLMRRRGSPSQRVRAAVSFMLAYYGEGTKELVDNVTKIAKDACEPDTPYRAEHISAYAQLLDHPSTSTVRGQIIRATPSSFFQLEDVPPEVRSLAKKTVREHLSDFEPWLENLGSILESPLRELMTEVIELEFDEAIGLVRALIEADGENWAAWAELGWLFLGKERLEEAEAAFRTANQLRPANSWVSMMLGILHLPAEPALAEQRFRQVVDAHPELAEGWHLLAASLGRQEKRETEMIESLNRVLELRPALGPAWEDLAATLEATKQFEAAEQAYRKAIEFGVDDASTWGRFGRLLCAERGPEYSDEARHALERSLELDRSDATVWRNYGRLLGETFKQFEEAKRALEMSLDLNDSNAWTWMYLGRLHSEAGEELSRAGQAYRKAVEVDSNHSWARLHLGQFLAHKRGEMEEAESLFRGIIEAQDSDVLPGAWAELGWIYAQRGDDEQASDAFQKGLDLRPEMTHWWLSKAIALTQLGRANETLECLEKVLELDPQDSNALGWAAGVQAVELGDYEGAIRKYRLLSELQPNDVRPWYQVGVLLHEQLERPAEAVVAFQAAVELEPESSEGVLSTLRLAALEQHPWAEALAHIDERLVANESAALHNIAAWYLYESGPRSTLEWAQRWARYATDQTPDDAFAAHTHATILASLGRIEEALSPTAIYLQDLSCVQSTVKDAVILFVEFAAHGAAERAAKQLRASVSAETLEAVLVALDLEAGTPSPAPRELVEVANDIREDIRRRREALAQDEVLQKD